MKHAKTTSKTAVYTRVSTLQQQSGVESQAHAIRAYLDGHGIAAARWYADTLSGATLDRPEFKRLQADIFAGRVQTVIVWKLDRLSRSLQDGINVLCEWLGQGVRVVAVAQQLDFAGPTGKLIAAVLLALGEMERESLRENTIRGLAAARAKGVKLGRPLSTNAAAIETLTRGGLSVSAIAAQLKVSRAAVYQMARRRGVALKELRSTQTTATA